MDLIDRQQAIEVCKNNGLKWAVEYLKAIPSVEPKGTWKQIINERYGAFYCSRCHSLFTLICGMDKMNYCPYCGARMEKENE